MFVSVRSICRVGSDTDPTTFQRKKCHLRRMEILQRFALKQKREADAKSPQCVAILKRYLKCKDIALKKKEEPDANKQQNSLFKPSPQLVQAYFKMQATIKHLKAGVMDAADSHRIGTYESLVRMCDDTYPHLRNKNAKNTTYVHLHLHLTYT